MTAKTLAASMRFSFLLGLPAVIQSRRSRTPHPFESRTESPICLHLSWQLPNTEYNKKPSILLFISYCMTMGILFLFVAKLTLLTRLDITVLLNKLHRNLYQPKVYFGSEVDP
jgi:hypothetical protein